MWSFANVTKTIFSKFWLTLRRYLICKPLGEFMFSPPLQGEERCIQSIEKKDQKFPLCYLDEQTFCQLQFANHYTDIYPEKMTHREEKSSTMSSSIYMYIYTYKRSHLSSDCVPNKTRDELGEKSTWNRMGKWKKTATFPFMSTLFFCCRAQWLQKRPVHTSHRLRFPVMIVSETSQLSS